MGLHDENDGMCMDAGACCGNFMVSTVPNTEVGGTRETPCHMDVPLRKCDMSVDNLLVVSQGDVVAPAASVAGC